MIIYCYKFVKLYCCHKNKTYYRFFCCKNTRQRLPFGIILDYL